MTLLAAAVALAASASLLDAKVGDTTKIGERLITARDYTPAPDFIAVVSTAVAFADQIKAAGINPTDVQHAVLLDPKVGEQVWVTTDVSPEDKADVTYTLIHTSLA